ncbi:molybdenum ABC transporter ATP-binding protein [Edaphobacter acidisoli]|uniref:Molybdenum ABC transporter ATP-binding protein n=1 Tax=Edaphobacter acidisoli TaxID=2040573 RepID=A0A916W1E3_9BACT|nr:ATP-binding cassette domain-containing protein [Edaphobacter acidisoli]GGA58105.1 molybdenum ABC transporter ATP-binding protein [Edaphobacter acidisoli]
MPTFLELSHVHVARGENVVLHDINLSVNTGEHIAILGPNGCGKSTLIKTITCECYPLVSEEGEPQTKVSIFGRERWDLTELKKRLGVVSAELPGRHTLTTTGRDAVLTGFFSSSTLWPNLTVTDEMRARAEEVLQQIDAVPLADKVVGEMSAGQQRRIMIGRALVASSQMLLLDEPSNALDLAAQADLRGLLRKLAQQGTGILLITHHIADIPPEIDRILMMKDGRIIADGPKSELLTAARLSELFKTEVEITQRSGFYHAW